MSYTRINFPFILTSSQFLTLHTTIPKKFFIKLNKNIEYWYAVNFKLFQKYGKFKDSDFGMLVIYKKI